MHTRFRVAVTLMSVFLLFPLAAGAASANSGPRNIILFVADGLRHDSVNPQDAPTLFSVRQRGVHFANSHSVYPTLTTPNAAAIATGHYPGDTGDFSNSEYVGFPIFNRESFGKSAASPTPFLENDLVLGDLNAHVSNGNFLNETSLLAIARAHGYNTAVIGKLGPAAIQDVSQLKLLGEGFDTPQTVILDDATGGAEGVPVSADMQAALAQAGLGSKPTARNQPAGGVSKPGTLSANTGQQQWFADAATKAILPSFVRSGRPFVLVYWSRDPDGSQHNHGDSLNQLTPGINGPTSRAGIADADANLRQLLDYLDQNPELRATTDLFVTSDHGFTTISRHEIDSQGGVTQSYSTTFEYRTPAGEPDVVRGWLPPGFLAIDLAHALDLPLYDADHQVSIDGAAHYMPVDPAKPSSASTRQHPASGNALLGGTGLVQDRLDARIAVSAGGGTDLIYIVDPGEAADAGAADRGGSASAGQIRSRNPAADRALARRIVAFLGRQDYVGGVFVADALGKIPGALPLSAISLEGTAQMPHPSLVVSFKAFRAHAEDLLSTAQIADSPLQEGQGMHGGLDRANTFNNMAALGPDFKQGFVSRSPAGNADILPTLAHILGWSIEARGKLRGRVLLEALAGGPDTVASRRDRLRSRAASSGKATVLHFQQVQGRRYVDTGCFISRAEHCD